jgi:hypothetical protein
VRHALISAIGLLVAMTCAGCGNRDDGPTRAVSTTPHLLRTIAPSTGRGPVVLARVNHLTEIAAFGGHVVWNERRAGGWILVHAFGTRVERLPVAPGREASAIDLGPGPDGSPTLLYARCGRPTDCAVHAYDLRRNRDRRLTELDAAGTVVERASIWRDDIAFARRRIGSANVEVLLRHGATGRLEQVPSETPVTCLYGGHPGPNCHAEIQSLDLGADLVAHVWTGVFAGDYSQPGTPHVMRRSDGRDRTLLTGYVSGACGSLAGTDVQVRARTVQFIRRLYNCTYDSSYVLRYDAATRRTTRVDPAPLRRGRGGAHAMARDGRDTYWLYSKRTAQFESSPDVCAARNGGCRILRSRDLRFIRPQPGDPRPSDGAEDGTA